MRRALKALGSRDCAELCPAHIGVQACVLESMLLTPYFYLMFFIWEQKELGNEMWATVLLLLNLPALSVKVANDKLTISAFWY